MGNSYCNVTLLGTNVDDVRSVAPRSAFVTSQHDAVVLFAEADDEGTSRSGERLSAVLGCVAVSVTVHDDDIFVFEVHDRGRSVVSFAVPDPAEFFGFEPEMLTDFDPELLDEIGGLSPSDGAGVPAPDAIVAAVQRGDVDAVGAALAEDVVFATQRHAAMAEALGLPLAAVGWGYRYLSRDAQSYTGPPLTRL